MLQASDLKSANNAAGVVGDLLRGIAFCYIDFDFKLVTEKDKSLCDFSTAAGFGFVAFVTKSDGAVLMRNHPNKFWLPFSSQSIPKDFLCPDSLMLLTLSDDEASDFAPLTDAIYEAFEFCNLDHGIIAKTHSYKPGNAWKPCGAIENFGNDWETDSEPEVEIAQATASSSNPEEATESSSTQVDPNPTSSENLADLEIPQSYFDGDQDALEENQLETSPGSSVHSIPKSPEPSGRGIHAVSPSPPPSPTYDPFDALLNSVNGGNMNRFVSHGSSASAERSSCTETNFTDPVRAFSQEIFVADDEIDAPSDKSDEEDFLSFSVESTGVSIVVDWAETVKKTKTNPFVSKLESKGASVVRKRLSVGDYLWVAHGSDGPESERLLSLPLVVERKRYDDLWSSIKDGRWREQKRRLKKTNLKVILLIEGKHNPRINGFPRQIPEGEDSALHPSKQSQEQALISAAVRDGMTVVHTKNVEESVNYLIQITNIFREVYSGRTLSSVTHQEFTCLKPNDPYPIKLMGFDYLQKFAVKTPGYSVRDVLAQGLLQVKGLTESKAKEIVTKYPTYRALWNAYLAIGEEPSDPNVGKDPVADEKKKLLKDLIDQGTGQKIGPAVSAVVWRTVVGKEAESQWLLDAAKNLALHLRALVDQDLGVASLQTIFDRRKGVDVATRRERNDEELLSEVTKSLSKKLLRYRRLLETACSAAKFTWNPVEDLMHPQAWQQWDPLPDCKSLPSKILRFNRFLKTEASLDIACFTSSERKVMTPEKTVERGLKRQLFVSSNLTNSLAQNQNEIPTLKWQFLVSGNGDLIRYPAAATAEKFRCPNGKFCSPFIDNHHKATFFDAKFPKRKLVLVLFDGKFRLGSKESEFALELLSLLPKNAELNVMMLGENGAQFGVQPGPRFCEHISAGVPHISTPRDFLACNNESSQWRRRSFVTVSAPALGCLAAFLDRGMNKTSGVNLSAGITAAVSLIQRELDALKNWESCGNNLVDSCALRDVHLVYVADKMDSLLQNQGTLLDTLLGVSSVRFSLLLPSSVADVQLLSICKVFHCLKWLSEEFTEDSLNAFDVWDTIFADGDSRETKMRLAPPIWDDVSQGLLVTASQWCEQEKVAAGLDVSLEEFTDPATYCSIHDNRKYCFVIDGSGRTLAHPVLINPRSAKDQAPIVYIADVERDHGFADILPSILGESSGQRNTTSIRYKWKHTEPSYLIFVIAEKTSKPGEKLSDEKRDAVNGPWPASEEKTAGAGQLVHHRLVDLGLPGKGLRFCKHFQRLATLDKSSVMFSPAALLDPHLTLTRDAEENPGAAAARAQAYAGYLWDTTHLVGNPGLRDGVKTDAQDLGLLSMHWRSWPGDQQTWRSVVRKYAATALGVSISFPGIGGNSEDLTAFDPFKQAWYLRAANFLGSVVISQPWLDADGAGFLVTISNAVKKPGIENVHAVLGMDVSMGFIYRMMAEVVPGCKTESSKEITCFLMDEKGYVVSHPSLFLPKSPLATVARGGRLPGDFFFPGMHKKLASSSSFRLKKKRDTERLHVADVEPVLANDLLHQDGIVEKLLCDQPADGTSQRFWKFRRSVSSVLKSRIHGEMCAAYSLVSVPETNLFLTVINVTACVKNSGFATVFCPCSTEDRSCFYCNRMEQKECECPCECPLTGDLTCSSVDEKRNPVCETSVVDGGVTSFRSSQNWRDSPGRASSMWVKTGSSAPTWGQIPPCFSYDCGVLLDEWSCRASAGCWWCSVAADGFTSLKKPFCGDHARCSWSVIGSTSPYNEVLDGRTNPDYNGGERESVFDLAKSTPVGPVAGGIMAVFLFLALGAYCYWHYGNKDPRDTNYLGDGFGGLRYRQRRNFGGLGEWDDDGCSPGTGLCAQGGAKDCLLVDDGKGLDIGHDVGAEDDDDLREIPSCLRKVPVSDSGGGKLRRVGSNTNHRRPGSKRAGAESDDMGYSTMTPLEDCSDAASCRGGRYVHHSGGGPSRRSMMVENPYRTSVEPRPAFGRSRSGSSRTSSPVLATEQSVVSAADSANGTDYTGTAGDEELEEKGFIGSSGEWTRPTTVILQSDTPNVHSWATKLDENRVMASVQVHFVDV
ncbi:unnamed protein product [Notodromas monacha]|uniref:Crossover junction endonuclease MUS81 n=1 Tax=Notodromas monacha TaxID=399045 RepID=A0A7R9GHR3_9CRUS|nr:unnamed protein product [Notodromas monacha]CAG0923168.1 unnamed protein product [Notodromas monacha]